MLPRFAQDDKAVRTALALLSLVEVREDFGPLNKGKQ
jgi:hypothetical protein